MTEYTNILVEQRGRVGLVTLNRPEALNALNKATMEELVAAVTAMDTDPGVGAVVITGSGKAFAAGRGHQGNGRRRATWTCTPPTGSAAGRTSPGCASP